jgi:hypothetical protein
MRRQKLRKERRTRLRCWVLSTIRRGPSPGGTRPFGFTTLYTVPGAPVLTVRSGVRKRSPAGSAIRILGGRLLTRRRVLGGGRVRPNSRLLRFTLSCDSILPFFNILSAAPRHRIQTIRQPPRKIANGCCTRLARIATLVKRVLVGVRIKGSNARVDCCTTSAEIRAVACRICCYKDGELGRINRLGLAPASNVRRIHLLKAWYKNSKTCALASLRQRFGSASAALRQRFSSASVSRREREEAEGSPVLE